MQCPACKGSGENPRVKPGLLKRHPTKRICVVCGGTGATTPEALEELRQLLSDIAATV